MALSRQSPPQAVFGAVTGSPEEAESLAYKDRKARKLAMARSKVFR